MERKENQKTVSMEVLYSHWIPSTIFFIQFLFERPRFQKPVRSVSGTTTVAVVVRTREDPCISTSHCFGVVNSQTLLYRQFGVVYSQTFSCRGFGGGRQQNAERP